MFTSLEQFYKNYRIKNEQQPNETTLNRPSMRLKREVRELKSVLDIITGEGIEEWTELRFYEKDEYVQYLGSYYISLLDDNISNNPTDYGSTYWALVDLPIIGKALPSLCKNDEFIADGEAQTFELSEQVNGDVLVYIDGVLQKTNTYTCNSRDVRFPRPPVKDAKISIVYGYQYISANQLPRRDFTASRNQYLFNTPFELTNPCVFVNGIMIPASFYTFSSNRVEFLYNLNEGDIVSITNGTFVGYDTYSKDELDNKLSAYLTTDTSYSKGDINTLLDEKVDIVVANEKYVTKSEIYDKVALENKFINFEDNITVKVNDTLKDFVTKGTTLADYGITDAYTQAQTAEIFGTLLKNEMQSGVYKEILESKLDASEFTALNIYNLLNTDEYYKNVVYNNAYQVLSGGVDVKQESKSEKCLSINTADNFASVPSIEVHTNISASGSSHYRVLSDLNADDLVVTIEGDFKGTFAFNLGSAGVHDYNKYNWVIKVIPTMSGDNLDFVPKGYGNKFTFSSTKTTSSSQSYYNYGWISNNGKTVNLVSACQCDNDVKETYAHYVLTGYDKRISQHRTYNQGDSVISVVRPKSETNEQTKYALNHYYDVNSPVAPTLNDNGLIKLTQDSSTPVNQYTAGTNTYTSSLKVYSDKYTVGAGSKCNIWVLGANINDFLTFTVDGNASPSIHNHTVINDSDVAFTISIDDDAKTSEKITLTVSGTHSAPETLVLTVA